MNKRHTLSTSEQRRETVIQSAIAVFARAGFEATPISRVAEHAGISPAYVFKLFPSKISLFVAALDRCYEEIERSLAAGARRAGSAQSSEILSAMGDAYAALIADRDLIMLQVHAQAATDEPEIAAAVRRGLARITTFAKERSGASDGEVQNFMAVGQLCHLITTLRLDESTAPWAAILANGIRHYPAITERK